MAAEYQTRDGDMIDEIAHKYYKSTAPGVVEQVLTSNPHIAEHGPVLPAGLTIDLPEIVTPEKKIGVRLWED